ncbi:MAG: hypothetical protein AAFW65_07530 [Pseudomonadota bacterium]
MAKNEKLDPVEYLDRFFDELRNEVRANPELASRLVKALGGSVVFDSGDADAVTNPFIVAAEQDKAHFYALYAPMKVSQIKRVLKDNNLATAVDVRGKTANQLIDMLYDRASYKVSERRMKYS